MIELASHPFLPVIALPDEVDVLDLTVSPPQWAPRQSEFSIGRYNEDRVGVYTQALFGGERTIHMGIDIGGPVGTEVRAPADGVLWCAGCNAKAGDYGPTIITMHRFNGQPLWMLYGHLSQASLDQWNGGETIEAGQLLGRIGSEAENGGWPPHLHFQLSKVEPIGCDLPGVVNREEHAQALIDYPDPRLVLGPLY